MNIFLPRKGRCQWWSRVRGRVEVALLEGVSLPPCPKRLMTRLLYKWKDALLVSVVLRSQRRFPPGIRNSQGYSEDAEFSWFSFEDNPFNSGTNRSFCYSGNSSVHAEKELIEMTCSTLSHALPQLKFPRQRVLLAYFLFHFWFALRPQYFGIQSCPRKIIYYVVCMLATRLAKGAD